MTPLRNSRSYPEGVTFTTATPELIQEVWRNAREHDRIEFELMGTTGENITCYVNADECLCGMYHGEPVAIFGYFWTGFVIHFFFLATPRMRVFWKTATKFATTYFENRLDMYTPTTGAVVVWEHHRESLAWLKRLGFVRDNTVYIDTPKGRLLWLSISETPKRTK